MNGPHDESSFADGSRRAFLDPARRRRGRRSGERQGVRGRVGVRPTTPSARPLPLGPRGHRSRRPLRDRDGAHPRSPWGTARRRGRRSRGHEMGCSVSALSIRDPPLAGRRHPRSAERHCDGASGDGCDPSTTTPRSGAVRAHAGMGARRARRRRDVELELRHLVAAETRRRRDGADRATSQWPRAGWGAGLTIASRDLDDQQTLLGATDEQLVAEPAGTSERALLESSARSTDVGRLATG